jgi:hypothetical protein
MEAIADYALQVLVLLLFLGFGIFMRFTRAGTEAQFFVLFTIVGFAVPTAVGAGVTLLAVDFFTRSLSSLTVSRGFSGWLFWLLWSRRWFSTSAPRGCC